MLVFLLKPFLCHCYPPFDILAAARVTAYSTPQVVAVKGDIKRHSDTSFRGEGYIQCCVGVRLCDMYSNQELAEVHFMYGKADGNAALARRLYQERYPQRQCPDRKTFVHFSRFRRTISSLKSVPGNVRDKVNENTANIPSKNSGYYQLKEIRDILEGKTLQKPTKFSIEQLTAFVQAPLIFRDVERSFSRYKAMLRDNRRRMTTENIRHCLVVKEIHGFRLSKLFKICPNFLGKRNQNWKLKKRRGEERREEKRREEKRREEKRREEKRREEKRREEKRREERNEMKRERRGEERRGEERRGEERRGEERRGEERRGEGNEMKRERRRERNKMKRERRGGEGEEREERRGEERRGEERRGEGEEEREMK
ncbi:hypothetical protein ANN_07621 [Periplaneta americana]|uniref:DUF4817 domain-containing protein n=1 Tax=Periplaneta americana TaxID=6978 RepID=A0ABQ8SZ37_PERAM|nr:hypothetical protein ANN_07621 [Periplaneta americana]